MTQDDIDKIAARIMGWKRKAISIPRGRSISAKTTDYAFVDDNGTLIPCDLFRPDIDRIYAMMVLEKISSPGSNWGYRVIKYLKHSYLHKREDSYFVYQCQISKLDDQRESAVIYDSHSLTLPGAITGAILKWMAKEIKEEL